MRWFFVFFLFLSCVESNPDYINHHQEIEKKAETSVTLALRESAWICHHPDTIYHGHTCADPEPLYPEKTW